MTIPAGTITTTVQAMITKVVTFQAVVVHSMAVDLLADGILDPVIPVVATIQDQVHHPIRETNKPEDMKASELRIGNLINDIGDFHEVAGIQFNGAEWWIAYKEYFEWFRFNTETGIPLTEEWLLKFGFRLYDDCGDLKGNDRFWSKPGFIGQLSSARFKHSTTGRYIQYIHQLQNLYHSLTGEELELTPSTV